MGGCCCCCPPDRKFDHPALGNPIKKRRCTDVLCLLVFFLFWAGMVVILVYTLLVGRVQRLLNGFDDYGNTCGVNNYDEAFKHIPYANQDMTHKPYQFFMNYYALNNSYAICVSECPTKNLSNARDVLDYYDQVPLCDYSIQESQYLEKTSCDLSFVGCYGPCPALPVLEQTPVFNRCLPKAAIEDPIAFGLNATVLSSVVQFFGQYRFFNEVASSFYIVRHDILILLATALGISLLLVFMMRFVIKIVVWFIVVVAALAAIAGTVVLWITWYNLYSGIDPQLTHTLPVIPIAVDARTAFLVYSITASVLTVILLLVIIVMRKRLQLAVALFQEAGRVLEVSPCLLIQPVWTYIFQILIVCLGIVMLVLCAGVTDAVKGMMRADEHGNRNHTSLEFVNREEVTYFWWYIVIGIVWMCEFSIAVQELIIAGTVAEWYFTRDKKKLSCTTCSATGRTIVYHLGSAALGSFLITLIRIPRYILMKFNQKLESNKTNECVKFLLKCCICCLYCLEKCMKFINRNAYIVVAISSTDFCKARVKAFNVLLNNILRVVAINTVGDFVLFLGKILVMSGNVVIAYFLFDRNNEGTMYGERNLFFLPTLAVAIFSYLIAHCFLSSFEMIVDTLLLCFCEDVNINDGSEDKPYYMSKTLLKFVANSSKALNKGKPESTVMDETDGGPTVADKERAIMNAADNTMALSVEDIRLTGNQE